MCCIWEHLHHELKRFWNLGPFSWHLKAPAPEPAGAAGAYPTEGLKVRASGPRRPAQPNRHEAGETRRGHRRTLHSHNIFSQKTQWSELQSSMTRCLVPLFWKAWSEAGARSTDQSTNGLDYVQVRGWMEKCEFALGGTFFIVLEVRLSGVIFILVCFQSMYTKV